MSRNRIVKIGNVVCFTFSGSRTDGYLPDYNSGYAIANMPSQFAKAEENYFVVGRVTSNDYTVSRLIQLVIRPDGSLVAGFGEKVDDCNVLNVSGCYTV